MKSSRSFFCGVLAVFLLMVLVFTACEMPDKDNPIQDEGPFPMRGTWVLTDKGDGAYTSSVLVVTECNGNNFKGFLDWNSTASTQFGKHYWGRESFNGVYNPNSGKITISGYEITDSHDVTIGLTRYYLVTGIYEAFVAANGVDFVQGTWWTDSGWEAKSNLNK
jgi:hypothetical protein